MIPRRAVAGYSGAVTIDPAARTLGASWTITFTADSTTSDSVVLLLNRGVTVDRVTGSNVASYGTTMHDDVQSVTIRFTSHTAPGKIARIDIAYAGIPAFGTDGINRISPHWVELSVDSHWLPIFAGYSTHIAGSVRIELPSTWRGVTSGSFRRDGDAFVLTTGTPLVDIAFAASPTFKHTDSGGSSVYYVQNDSLVPDSLEIDSASIARTLMVAESCRRYLDARYGAKEPLPPTRLVLAPRKGPGSARWNYIAFTVPGARAPAPQLGSFLCHEFAHFWSSRANSSGPDNWLNEGFAEYVAARYIHATFGDSAYDVIVDNWRRMSKDQPPVWTPQATKRPGQMVSYRKAPLLLSELEERVGSDTMDRFLKRYMVDRIATTPELLRALRNVAGQETEEWFRDQLAH